MVANWRAKVRGQLKTFHSLYCLVGEEDSGVENTSESLKGK